MIQLSHFKSPTDQWGTVANRVTPTIVIKLVQKQFLTSPAVSV